MAEDLAEEENVGVVYDVGAGVLSFFFGLFTPALFTSLTLSAGFGVYIVVFSIFAATILYGELGVSTASGVAFGLGMLLTSFVAQNSALVLLAIIAVTINLAWNWPSETGTDDMEDLGYEPSVDPTINEA
jgi:hypothetical protein